MELAVVAEQAAVVVPVVMEAPRLWFGLQFLSPITEPLEAEAEAVVVAVVAETHLPIFPAVAAAVVGRTTAQEAAVV